MNYDCLSNLYVYYNESEDKLKFTHCCIDRSQTITGELSVTEFYNMSDIELYTYLNDIALTKPYSCFLNNNEPCDVVWKALGNKILTFVVAISRECNLSCPMCYAKAGGHKDSPKRKQLYFDFIKRLNNFEFNQLKLTDWGEPLLYIKDIVDLTKDYKYCKSIQIITNGTLLFPETLDLLTSSFDEVYIEIDCDSLDKDTFEKIRVGADYNSYRSNLMNVIRESKIRDNLHLQLHLMKLKENAYETLLVKEFAQRNDVVLYMGDLLDDVSMFNC